MNVAEWIIVGILSFTLFVFLILGIILLAKLIKLTKEAKLVIERGQDVVDRANDVVDNVKRLVAGGNRLGLARVDLEICFHLSDLLYHRLTSPTRLEIWFTVTSSTMLMAVLNRPTAVEKLYCVLSTPCS